LGFWVSFTSKGNGVQEHHLFAFMIFAGAGFTTSFGKGFSAFSE
jgi:hypothetical protein